MRANNVTWSRVLDVCNRGGDVKIHSILGGFTTFLQPDVTKNVPTWSGMDPNVDKMVVVTYDYDEGKWIGVCGGELFMWMPAAHDKVIPPPGLWFSNDGDEDDGEVIEIPEETSNLLGL